MKRCSKCGEMKDTSEFCKKGQSFASKCKECRSIEAKDYRANNKEYLKEYRKEQYANNKVRINARVKEYRTNNKERIKEYKKEYQTKTKEHRKEYLLKRNYGISLAEWQEIYSRQDGKCAACGRVEKLEVDHHHETGKVRGLLCHSCNISYGKMNEDVTAIEGLLRYAMKWQGLDNANPI